MPTNKKPNKILAEVLAENIKKSQNGNGSFDLNIEKESKIDKSEGMIIGLHTDWGGGKTTLIEDLEKELGVKKDEKGKNKPPYFFQTINAWEFNKENKEDLWKSIISFFYLKIIDDNTSFIEKNGWKEQSIEIINLISKIGFSFGGLEVKPLKGIDVGKLFVNKYNEKIIELKDNISLFYSMKEKIKKILEAEDQFEKYILVIDDLDRCSPKEVVNLLDSLKIFLDLPNVIVIVAVDRRHIEKGIYEVYNKDNGEQYLVNPDEYLEKIIHLPIDLFLFDDDIKDLENNDETKNKITKENNDETNNEDERNIKIILQKKENKEIINFGLSNNPRKILRFKRLFKFYYNVFKKLEFFNKDKDTNERFLIFWLVLKLEWGDYFKEIIRKPLILNYVENDNTIDVLHILSELFYGINKNENFLKFKSNNKEIKYLDLLNNFEEEKLRKFIKFLKYYLYVENDINISIYFSSYILGLINYLVDKSNENEKELLKPLVDLDLYDKFNFKNFYIEIIKKLYEDSKMNDKVESNEYLNNFEANIIKNLLGMNTEVDDFSLKDYTEKNNINISEYGLGGDGEIITGLVKYTEAKEKDERRFGLGNKIFFDKLLSSFNDIYNLKIKSGENIQNKFSKLFEIKSEQETFYKILGENHILNNLENGVKRTMFGEIINQMSFAKFGPSIGGMVGATDFIQLENIIISNIKNESIDKWKEIIKDTIILVDKISPKDQLDKYKKMLEFVENINDEAKSKIKRLKKRLLYIFSHFWALQNIENFPVYYGKSREGLASLGVWSYKYGDLDVTIKNYKDFSEKYGELVKELKENKLVEEFKVEKYNDTLNKEFEKDLGKQNNKYIENYYNYKIIQDLLYNTVLESSEKKYNKKIIHNGEIWVISLDDGKKRPYLVLKRLQLDKYIVVGLTQKAPKNNINSYSINEEFLNKKSFLNFQLLEIIEGDNFINKLGKINNNEIKKIEDKYNEIINL